MKPRAFDLGIFVWLLQIARYLCSQDPIFGYKTSRSYECD